MDVGKCRLVQPLWKAVWNFLRKLKMKLPFDPAIPLLGIYPKNSTSGSKELMQPYVYCGNICNHQVLKQPKCPLVNE